MKNHSIMLYSIIKYEYTISKTYKYGLKYNYTVSKSLGLTMLL